MAQLGLAVVGYGVGSYFGYGSLGWAVGSMLGQYFFSPDLPPQLREGPRLTDLSVTSSAYGRMIPFGYGTYPVTGNVIWSTGLQEEAITETTSVGGKGFPGSQSQSVETTTYAYFASFALLLCEGPVADVTRIWADGKLIFDKRGSGNTTRMEGLSFRFYPGSETQDADALIMADVGADNASAWRGWCYLVFERLPLENFARRIPTLEVEVAFAATESTPQIETQHLPGGTGYGEIFPDLRRGYLYTSDEGGTPAISRIRISDMVQEALVEQPGPPADCRLLSVLPVTGYLVAKAGNDTWLIDPTSLQPVDQLDDEPTPQAVPVAAKCTGFASNEEEYFARLYQTGGPNDDRKRVYCYRTTDGVLEYVWDSEDVGPDIVTETDTAGAVAGLAEDGAAVLYVFGGGTGSGGLTLCRLTVQDFARYNGATGQSDGVTFETVAHYDPGDLIAGESSLAAVKIGMLDRTDGSLLIQVQDAAANAYLVKITPADGAIVYSTLLPESGWPNQTAMNHARIDENRAAFVTGSDPRTVYVIDTRTGEQIDSQAAPIAATGVSTRVQFYDSGRDAVFHEIVSETNFVKILLGRATGNGALLSDIVTDLCARAGLAASDIDVSDLTGITVPGYLVGRQATIRSCIEQLAVIYRFDAVESDYVLKFPLMGKAPVAALTQAQLCAPGGGAAGSGGGAGEYLIPVRAQDVDLPRRVSISYLDIDLDYESGLQSTPRVVQPDPTMFSESEIAHEVPIVETASVIRQAAERVNYTAWVGRTRFRTRLDWSHILLDPCDAITVTLDSGTVHTLRLGRIEISGDGYAMDVEGTSERAAAYVSTSAGGTGQGVPNQAVLRNDLAKLFVLDVPLLRDIDAAPAGFSRYYYAGSHWDDNARWTGERIYQSVDGSTFATRASIRSPAPWGVTIDALGDVDWAFTLDRTNSVTVSMRIGADELESVTYEALRNGANTALVGDEVIRFQTVTENTDGTFTLSNLARGRRGTDTLTGDHVAGERFILLSVATMERDLVELAQLGESYDWRGVSFGHPFADGDRVTAALTGRDLMPWAPVHATAETNTDGSVTFSWTRRTRVGGQLKSGGDAVPLSEDSEAYKIDIYDEQTEPQIVRTLDATTSSVTYEAADILTDFGTDPPATWNVRIYQISAQLTANEGRGYSYEWMLAA